MKAPSSGYMPHVDGLRCVAVMSVLLFHFGIPGLDGGYVGVDVFFVISGYLITKIIVDEVVGTGGFDFGNFYSRRIRRILPALIATLAATTIMALASLTPSDLVAYGKSLVASALSVSNLLFWSESGYFDAASQTKPLLHTWSLSVEEQFYLFWPAFIYLAFRKFGRKGLLWSIVVAGVASFAANHFAVTIRHVGYGSDLFFLPHFRVFEFAIGAVGCFVVGKLPPSRMLQELMMALGLGLIVYSIISLKEGMVFPYVNAIAPCTGALLVIMARGSLIGRALLANGVSTWIGRISYSLYLTHWPIVIFVGQFMPATAWVFRFMAMASLSLATAVALHYLVEARFRHAGARRAPSKIIRNVLAVSGGICALGVVVALSNGMIWRYQYFTPGSLLQSVTAKESTARPAGNIVASQAEAFAPLGAAAIDAGKSRRFEDIIAACNIQVLQDKTRCFRDRPSQVLLFGNSHEPDAFNAFNRIYGKDERVNLINFGTVNNCEIVFDKTRFSSPTPDLACDQRFKTLNSGRFLKGISVIVYNTHHGFDPVARDLWAVLELVKKRNPSIKIVAIGSYLQTTVECASLYNRYRTYEACRRQEFVNYHNPGERENSPVPQVKSLDYLYISKYRLLCGGDRLDMCLTYVDGEPASYDQHHLSRSFARHLGERMAEVHREDLAKIGLPVPEGIP